MNVTKKLILSTNFGFCAIELVVAKEEGRALWQKCGGGFDVTIERFCSKDTEWSRASCPNNTCVPQIDKNGIIWYAQCKPRVHPDPCEDLPDSPDSPDTKPGEKVVALWGRCIRAGFVTRAEFVAEKYHCDIGECVPQTNKNNVKIWYAQCRPNPCEIHNGGCDQNAECTFDVFDGVSCAFNDCVDKSEQALCKTGVQDSDPNGKCDETNGTCVCRGFTVTSVDNELCALFSENTDACAECVSSSDDVGNDDVLYCYKVNNGGGTFFDSFFNDETGLSNFIAKYDGNGYGIAASINAYIASNGDGGAYNNNYVTDGGTTINFFFCSAQDP